MPSPGGRIYALTSLSPKRLDIQRAAIASWRAVGLFVRAFCTEEELLEREAQFPGVEFVTFAASDWPDAVFDGHPYTPIAVMLSWAQREDARVLLINSDIELALPHEDLVRAAELASGGVFLFNRHEHAGDKRKATRQQYGVDGFLLHGRDAQLWPETWLCMGKPCWDFALPDAFARAGRPVVTTLDVVCYHLKHPVAWEESWGRCTVEHERASGDPPGPATGTNRELAERSCRYYHRFMAARKIVSLKPPASIHEWIEQNLGHPEPKTILELGAHRGEDTIRLALLPAATVHAFEPDPRNSIPRLQNVVGNRAAVWREEGTRAFRQSASYDGRPWSESGSLREPTGHRDRYPGVTFGDQVEVACVTLDGYTQRHGLGRIDLIWADVQGAEGDVIAGARETLARTLYLYTECSETELYEGQTLLPRLLAQLPGWAVVGRFSRDGNDNVLLANRNVQ